MLNIPSFTEGARNFFQPANSHLPAIDFKPLSQNAKRFKYGYQFWQSLKADIHPTIHLVAHSMGCAFAEGLASAAEEDDYIIGKVVYINCYQARKLAVSTKRQFTVDYQFLDDPLINSPFLSHAGHAIPGDIQGADYKLRIYSGIKNPLKRHRAPMGQWGYHFWPHLWRMIH